ncbi:MAG: hypothetical protein M2R46_00141 [Verrucomicrobia subdivision 3 bacterium]|nr:hypothetical protein [Limisphaerales bacterium]
MVLFQHPMKLRTDKDCNYPCHKNVEVAKDRRTSFIRRSLQ